MENKAVINVVATRCRPEIEEKFNKWYDEVHIPLLFKFKGMKEVTRYKILKDIGEYPAYLAIYRFENREDYAEYAASQELVAGRKEMAETWKDGGFDIEWRVQYEVMKTWKR
ncbi:MAG: DUF4286 family protein [Dehalococcoidales bacterium]|jgi:antibiotic biosynthesis monooxygenase (ABM) superfamily enzyme|nr:DUF4286 family protein [Dehalococcoidales bacterium]